MTKQINTRSAKYLAFVRSRPCVVTGQDSDYTEMVAHHVRCLSGGGTSLKPSDYMTVPMTAYEHALLHSKGESAYWAKKNVDPEQMIKMTLLTYLATQSVGTELLIEFIEGL
jgi:hypothetical protein